MLSHLKIPDKAFNTSLLDIKQRSCGDALQWPVWIAGVYFVRYIPTLYPLRKLRLRDESKLTKAQLINVSEPPIPASWVIWKHYINYKREKWSMEKLRYATTPWCAVLLKSWQSFSWSRNFIFLQNWKVHYCAYNTPPPPFCSFFNYYESLSPPHNQ